MSLRQPVKADARMSQLCIQAKKDYYNTGLWLFVIV